MKSEYHKIGLNCKSAVAFYLDLISRFYRLVELKSDFVIGRISRSDRIEFSAVKGENLIVAPKRTEE